MAARDGDGKGGELVSNGRVRGANAPAHLSELRGSMDKNSDIIISRDELEALGRVVRYLWDDESKSFCELPLEGERENHIFRSLATLGHVYDRNLIRADTAKKTYTFNVTASVNFGFDVEAENLREATKKMRALINAP